MSNLKQSQVCLFKILGLVFYVADTIGKGWVNRIALVWAPSPEGVFTERDLFTKFVEVFDQLPSQNGVFLITQLLGRVDHSCSDLVEAITTILIKLVEQFPHQVIWSLLDLYRRYEDVPYKKDMKDKYVRIYKNVLSKIELSVAGTDIQDHFLGNKFFNIFD